MTCQKKYFYWLLLSCVLLTLFSGCAYDILTKKVFNELESNPPIKKDGEREEPKKPEDIQYYISKKVKLELSLTYPELDVTKNGKIIKTNRAKRREVTIAKRKKGKLQFTDDNGYLVVGFEKDYPKCLIRFGQLFEGDDERYYLIYNDKQNRTIKYGDKESGDIDYNVKFEGDNIDNLPYLEIRKKDRPKPDPKWRWARGWKVNE